MRQDDVKSKLVKVSRAHLVFFLALTRQRRATRPNWRESAGCHNPLNSSTSLGELGRWIPHQSLRYTEPVKRWEEGYLIFQFHHREISEGNRRRRSDEFQARSENNIANILLFIDKRKEFYRGMVRDLIWLRSDLVITGEVNCHSWQTNISAVLFNLLKCLG